MDDINTLSLLNGDSGNTDGCVISEYDGGVVEDSLAMKRTECFYECVKIAV